MRNLYVAELVEIKCKKTKWSGDRKMEYKKRWRQKDQTQREVNRTIKQEKEWRKWAKEKNNKKELQGEKEKRMIKNGLDEERKLLERVNYNVWKWYITFFVI